MPPTLDPLLHSIGQIKSRGLLILIVLLALIIWAGAQNSGSSSETTVQPANPMPVATANRFSLCVALGRDNLDKKDLETIAKRYGVPVKDLGELLRRNDKCREGPAVERLNLKRPCDQSPLPDRCRSGTIVIPLTTIGSNR